MQANRCLSRSPSQKFVISAGDIELAAKASRLDQFELHVPQNGGGSLRRFFGTILVGRGQRTAVLPTCELLKSKPGTGG
jgi:hypothetical protein